MHGETRKMQDTPPKNSPLGHVIHTILGLIYRNAVLILAVIVLALWGWRAMTPRQLFETEKERLQFLSSVGAPPSTRIITLGTEWCPACKQLEHQLTSDNVPHLALDVEHDAAGRDLFRRVADITGSNSIPKIILDKDIVSRPKLFMVLAGDEGRR
jgi:glutaredoxin